MNVGIYYRQMKIVWPIDPSDWPTCFRPQ